MPRPLRVALLTDTHFLPPGQTLYGFSPRAHLERALAAIRRLPPVDLLVVMGDLTDRAEEAAYRLLAEVLADLPFPVVPMLGNHDRRAAFRMVFDAAPDVGGFVQSATVLEQATLITLDTLDEENPGHQGRLCPARLAFLTGALRAAPADRPVLVFQHHPVLDLAIPAMDAIRLVNPEDELAAFAAAGRRPDYMFFGHVHRPIGGLWHGIPFHLQRGLMHQVAPRFEETGVILGATEGPDLGFLRIQDGAVVIHSIPFLHKGPAFDLESAAAAAVACPADLVDIG